MRKGESSNLGVSPPVTEWNPFTLLSDKQKGNAEEAGGEQDPLLFLKSC